MTALIILVSKEGNEYSVSSDVCKLSKLVSETLSEEEEDITTISLPNATNKTLGKVVEFLKHYTIEPMSEIPKPLPSSNMDTIVQKWYADFMNINQIELIELTNCANYMDIEPLLDLTCATFATQIKGKTPEEIKTIFQFN
jgi:S-phase kinase-associated protein 1